MRALLTWNIAPGVVWVECSLHSSHSTHTLFSTAPSPQCTSAKQNKLASLLAFYSASPTSKCILRPIAHFCPDSSVTSPFFAPAQRLQLLSAHPQNPPRVHAAQFLPIFWLPRSCPPPETLDAFLPSSTKLNDLVLYISTVSLGLFLRPPHLHVETLRSMIVL